MDSVNMYQCNRRALVTRSTSALLALGLGRSTFAGQLVGNADAGLDERFEAESVEFVVEWNSETWQESDSSGGSIRLWIQRKTASSILGTH